jgi:hypothetical protein
LHGNTSSGVRTHPLLLVLALVLASCGPSLEYRDNAPLTQGLFHSRDGVLTGKIPQGWFSSTEDTLAPALTVWLIKEDFSAAMAVRELKLDKTSAERVRSEGLKLLAMISSGLHEEGMQPGSEPREFELRGKKFCGYELSGSSSRIVVFAVAGRYYECQTAGLNRRWSRDEAHSAYNVQQSVLASLAF